jgi:single-stranded-DNA-specific exonuclease
VNLEQLTSSFWRELQRLEPFGSGHPAPLFWSSRCCISQQRLLRGGHLQLTLRQGESTMRAIAWRWGGGETLPKEVDVAFQLRLNRWNGTEQLQLELAALRASSGDTVLLERSNRHYWVSRDGDALVIRNAAGDELRGQPDLATSGGFYSNHPNNDHPYVQALLQDAAMAMGLAA